MSKKNPIKGVVDATLYNYDDFLACTKREDLQNVKRKVNVKVQVTNELGYPFYISKIIADKIGCVVYRESNSGDEGEMLEHSELGFEIPSLDICDTLSAYISKDYDGDVILGFQGTINFNITCDTNGKLTTKS